MFGAGSERVFKIVQRKLDGLLLTIEGVHRSKRYRFQAYTARGNNEDTEAKVADGQLVWGMTVPQFGQVRYTITRDNKGRWFEVGEVAQDGKPWRKFFEMTLVPVQSK